MAYLGRKFFDFADDWMDEFALRLSYGVTGNRPDYEYLHYARYSSFGTSYIDIPAIKPSSLQLTDLKWERSTSYNLGVDLSLFDWRYRLWRTCTIVVRTTCYLKTSLSRLQQDLVPYPILMEVRWIMMVGK